MAWFKVKARRTAIVAFLVEAPTREEAIAYVSENEDDLDEVYEEWLGTDAWWAEPVKES